MGRLEAITVSGVYVYLVREIYCGRRGKVWEFGQLISVASVCWLTAEVDVKLASVKNLGVHLCLRKTFV